MGTPFEDIYDIFYSNIESRQLALLDDINLKTELSQWLMNGMVHFTMAKENIYNYSRTEEKFGCQLGHLEQQILGKCMTLEYLNIHLLKEDNLSVAMVPKDWRTYSSAKQLDSILKVKEFLTNEINALMSRYSYSGGRVREKFKRETRYARSTFEGI